MCRRGKERVDGRGEKEEQREEEWVGREEGRVEGREG